MTRTIYTLLVGIDAYPKPVAPLNGCVNDIRRVEELLQARVTGDGDRWQPLVLTNEKATRQAIIDGFHTHLAGDQVQPGDVALFYYSGHGSQSHSPQEFWHLEPDRLDETLVCYDSRLPGGWDLADKELAQLISEVAAKDAHIAVILDCCHSGSGTRELLEEGVNVRRVPTDDRVRPIESFLVDAAQATALSRGGGDAPGGWYTLPKGRHVVLSACTAEELAKELRLGGEQRGAFSYFLLESLSQGGAGLTYRDLFKRVNALVRARVAAQSPQMEATQGDDLQQPFLGGVVKPTPSYYTLRYDDKRGWLIDGGAVHGLPAPAGDETTHLALFAFGTDVSELQDLKNSIGTAAVTSVLPTESQVALTFHNDKPADPGTTYKAIITALPLTKLSVALLGDEAALTLVRTALAKAGPNQNASLLVQEGALADADLTLTAARDCYRIGRRGDGYALVVDTIGFNPGGAQLAVQRLEHIARWSKITELANPASKLGAQDVRMEVLLPDNKGGWQPAAAGREVRLDYYFAEGEWQQPTFKVKLTNQSKRRLFCMLFDLPESYGVFSILPGAGVWLEKGQEAWANDGEPIYGSIPDEIWAEGVVEFKETLKLIVTTDEGDATLLQQGDLPITVTKDVGSTRSINTLNTLSRLMSRVHTRHFSSLSAKEEKFADWVTTEVSFTTVRPLAATPIGQAGTQAKVAPTVTIQGHAQLSARARLTTLPDATRDAGSTPLPALIRDHEDLFTPLSLAPSRSDAAGLSVLELIDVEDHTVVTAAEPLVINLDVALADNEALLPLGYDGEFYLPLGRFQRTANGVQVVIERLPAPTGTRDLKGSIKMLFQKLVGQPLGWEYTYPQLAIARIEQGQPVGYNKDPDAVKKAVTKAKRILLYVHGIIGDTRAMAASAFPAFKTPPLAVAGLGERYDLLLTFDYENFHTPIEENARLLKARLADAGLGPNDDKTLHVVAHSMGGLVSRWFIEREGGDRVVDHLVMCGTPNNGSPWPTLQDYITFTLSMGLNGLTTVAWPASVLTAFVEGLELVDNALDQMNPGSDFLKNLAASPKPAVPYSLIAGNTSLVAAALEKDQAGLSLFDRLWARLKPKPWLHTVTAPLFFGQPNDIAVTVASVRHAPMGDQAIEVACDHTTYFNTKEGLELLAQLLPAA